jgi:hypothetical protein
MNVEFRGLEIHTPVGGIAVGRGYSRVAGEDYFRGLAVELPFGRFRLGWRVWDQARQDPSDIARAYQKAFFCRHAITYVWTIGTIFAFSLAVGRGDWFNWVAGVWLALLGLHFMQVFVLTWVESWFHRKQQRSSLAESSPSPPAP